MGASSEEPSSRLAHQPSPSENRELTTRKRRPSRRSDRACPTGNRIRDSPSPSQTQRSVARARPSMAAGRSRSTRSAASVLVRPSPPRARARSGPVSTRRSVRSRAGRRRCRRDTTRVRVADRHRRAHLGSLPQPVTALDAAFGTASACSRSAVTLDARRRTRAFVLTGQMGALAGEAGARRLATLCRPLAVAHSARRAGDRR